MFALSDESFPHDRLHTILRRERPFTFNGSVRFYPLLIEKRIAAGAPRVQCCMSMNRNIRKSSEISRTARMGALLPGLSNFLCACLAVSVRVHCA
jgi:hypothetical protein